MSVKQAPWHVPPVILGCGTFGGIGGARHLIGHGLDESAAWRTLDEAAALGLTMWDTAERYAHGESESTIGVWLASRPPDLVGQIRIATKVAPASLEGMDGVPFDTDYVQRKLDASLERLGCRRVAMYMAHALCDTTPVQQTVEAFAAVIESGRAERIGCCNVGPGQLLAALEAAARHRLPGFEWVQNSFSLLTPGADREVRAICRERGIGYSPYSPLAGGVLTAKYRRGEPFPSGTRMALRPDGTELTDSTYGALDTLRGVAQARGNSSAAVAMAWIIGHPDCAAPVAGPSRTAPHLGHVAEAISLTLTHRERDQLDLAFGSLNG